jgi:hypothetical protein
MARHLTIAAAGGVISAACYLATLIDAPAALILAYLALLPLCATGLGWGASTATIAAVIAAAVVAVMVSAMVGFVFVLAYGVPAALAVWLMLRSRAEPDESSAWYPVGPLVSWLAIYACGSFALLALLGGDSGVREGIAEIEKIMTSVMPVDQNPQVAVLVRVISGFFPAIVISSWLVMVLVNLALAQGVLERFQRNLRPRPKAATIALPDWYTMVTVAVAAVALIARLMGLDTAGFIARNTALALLVPHVLVGLAVVHVWARQWPARLAILAGFYLLLLVFGWLAFLAVAGLGFMEQWLHLRRRFARGGSQEDEQ